MKSPSKFSTLLQSDVRETGLYKRLRTRLSETGLKRVRFCVAYARWDGFGLISSELETFISSGGAFDLVVGAGNGVTTPDALLYGIYLKEILKNKGCCRCVIDSYINAAFHPKLYQFIYKNKVVVIFGSSNLTGAGLSRNTEFNGEVSMGLDDPLVPSFESAWGSLFGLSQNVSPSIIRAAQKENGLGSENETSETRADKRGKPHLRPVRVNRKPLFAKVLRLENSIKKSSVLSKMDSLSEKPEKLYLQILPYETGAQAPGGVGYQIQLPVATLAAFFGVAPNERREASFRFDDEIVTVHLTHFSNATHRVRLSPLRNHPRPAVLIFHRVGKDQYDCSVVPPEAYEAMLASKCTEQTRAGARRWGLE